MTTQSNSTMAFSGDQGNGFLQLQESTPVVISPVSLWNHDLHHLMKALFNITPKMHAKYITCLEHKEILDNLPDLIELTLKVWPNEELDYKKATDLKVVMPSVWTKRIYLSLLELSIKKNGIISIETIYINDVQCRSINDLHHLFKTVDVEHLDKYLTNNSYYYKSSNE